MTDPNRDESRQRQHGSFPDDLLLSVSPSLQSGSSRFESTIANSHTILESLIAQLPTESILRLYQTSSFLRTFLRNSPTSWKHMSWRLHQPAQAQSAANVHGNGGPQTRQSSSYALDQLLMYVILPFSTRLTSLVLDNTAVSGATLFQTVMILRKDTLEHVSVRGCKNVSLKYHINPWLTMHAMALEQPQEIRPPELQRLALKSLYTYRCRHHRRRPYLPSSLAKKESDSEPTHELVLTCHKLGIWTDTAWCTTPGARCYRRRGYVTMRVQQDPREVWVVYDRLWRSRNWLGPPPPANADGNNSIVQKIRKRKRDGRVWEDEDAFNGEPTGVGSHGKHVPVHLRESHRRFVEDIHCDSCSEKILERCEQCSVMMHCSGCRKTLCASCAFDRPYLRNQNASEEEKSRFWWAPGYAVSPCSMQDADPVAAGAANQSQALPNIKFKWCCTEPVFSGGGGITLGLTQNHDADKLRAAPLLPGQGFEDAEFASQYGEETQEMGFPLSRASYSGPGGRWASLAEMFRYGAQMNLHEDSETVPRILCHECYTSDQWKIKCKACAVPLCLKHDVKEKQRVRICGYKELVVEKQELIARLKATKLFRTLWLKRKEQQELNKLKKSDAEAIIAEAQLTLAANVLQNLDEGRAMLANPSRSIPVHETFDRPSSSTTPATVTTTLPIRLSESSNPNAVTISTESEIMRPLSPGSNSTGPLSRSSSPAPSARSQTATPEPNVKGKQKAASLALTSSHNSHILWRGCQAFFCSSSRPAGDHRRRCNAFLRQCNDCQVYVCGDCTSSIDKPCPCQGCRLPSGETDHITGSTAAFYCPNCRHDRIINRKCKRSVAYLTRSMSNTTPQKSLRRRNKLSPTAKLSHIADILGSSELAGLDADFSLEDFYGSIHYDEFQELREISMSAVNVVKRVQSLRSHAAPGSPAALALPVITIEEADTNA